MMSRESGRSIPEIDHIIQSIQDILTTPLGSRIMRREYGSMLPDLIDQPTTSVLILKLYSAIYTAISRWEDRISIEQIQISNMQDGQLVIDLDAVYYLDQKNIGLNIPLKMGAS